MTGIRMDAPVDDLLANEHPLCSDIKVEIKEDETEETECLFLPSVEFKDGLIPEHNVDKLHSFSSESEDPLNLRCNNIALDASNLENASLKLEKYEEMKIDINNKQPHFEEAASYDSIKVETDGEEFMSAIGRTESLISEHELCAGTTGDSVIENKINSSAIRVSLICRNNEENCYEKKNSDNESEFVLQNTRDIKEFKCEYCEKICKTKWNLTAHISIHTNKMSFPCSFCGKVFNKKGILRKHINIHTREKTFICNVCQMSLSDRGTLMRHLNIHTKEKIFTCDFCHSSFHRRSNLIEHLNTHSNDKKFVCDFCQKSFSRKDNLKTHLNIHTNEKSFVCSYCKKSFHFSNSLRTHIKTHIH
ncbi:uncharacterized protein LOC142320866 isoform X3 [Lycorma delicatula]|uniref:uncharacterized protein LOC142320866 isoform X3 n=1 Tax=Lycorma delicatula TaxID=130591 RepID=UPI003F5148B7